MPYKLSDDGKCVMKSDSGETVKCHESHEKAVAHLRALEANVHDSLVEMSLRITKASYNKSENAPMKWAAIDSDTDEDLYEEKMSLELYQDFVSRIENNTPVPEPFREAVCEADWCGGMPYLSIAHYKAGTQKKNTPGEPISVFIDGNRLKSKGILYDSDMGRRTFDALCDDLYRKKSDPTHLPVRISIGFLDLEHKHRPVDGGQEFVFTRSKVGQICPLCASGIGGKIYTKGQLIHLAMTRVPVNPRTEMSVERSMDEITTKKQDAESIIGELANELEEKSIASDVLVVRAEDGSLPSPDPSELTKCYDPNTGGWDNACIASVMDKYMPAIRDSIGVPVKSETMPKGLLDVVVAHIYKSNGYEVPVVEDAMEAKKEDTSVEKAVAGIPEKPFSHTQFGVTVNGDGQNTVASPVSAKAEADEKPEDEKKEHMQEMSAVEKSFQALQEAIKSGDVDAVNKAFGSLGTSVESEFKPQVKPVDANDIAAIVKSAMADALMPVVTRLSVLEATQKSNIVSNDGPVKSKALSLNPGGLKVEDIVRRSGEQVPSSQPTKQLSQIQKLARKSTGLQS